MEFCFKHFWSDNIPSNVIDDILRVENIVFGHFYTLDYFERKFVANIYGPSLITIVYYDNRPAAVDILWRNDIEGVLAYQTVDTCVLEEYRGRGLFTQITQREIDFVGKDVLIYGYPNINSRPGYIKMKWQYKQCYRTLVWNVGRYVKKHHAQIDTGYAKWWLSIGTNLKCVKWFNRFLLVRVNKGKPWYFLIGELCEDAAKLYPIIPIRGFIIGMDVKPTLFSRKAGVVVSTKDVDIVPDWKVDAV